MPSPAELAEQTLTLARPYADVLAPQLLANGGASLEMLRPGEHRDADYVIAEGANFGAVVAEVVHLLELDGLLTMASYAPISAMVGAAQVDGERCRGVWRFQLVDTIDGEAGP